MAEKKRQNTGAGINKLMMKGKNEKAERVIVYKREGDILHLPY